MVSKDPKMSKQGTADKRKHVTKHLIIKICTIQRNGTTKYMALSESVNDFFKQQSLK
jgi:hypothetical protein